MRELELLSRIFRDNADLPEWVLVPPGDDMAVLRWPPHADAEAAAGRTTLLIAVDQIADGVHFELASTRLALVARKAVTRNLSDVAAMGASPVASVASAMLPRAMSDEDASALSDALREAARRGGCPMVGGDVGAWDAPLQLSVTVLASAMPPAPILRSGGQPGDRVFVTGALGGSLEPVKGDAAQARHLRFEPRLDAGRRLAASGAVHAMIDLSDGLASDLPRLCRASGVRARLEVERLPITDACRRAAARSGREPWDHAMTDGEDYELCFAAAEALAEPLDVAVTQIGELFEGEPGVDLIMPDGSVRPCDARGFEHGG